MEELAIKNISGWQNNEYVIVGYTSIRDVEEFISFNASVFNRCGSKVAIINLNTESYCSIEDPENTIVLQNCNSIFDLRKSARLSMRENNVHVIFIDNLQMINCQDLYVNSSTDLSNIISRSVRGICRELARPIISLVPISPIKNASGLIDLNCIGGLQFNADVVIFLTRDDNNRLKLLIAKNRNGFVSDLYYSIRQDDNFEVTF